MQLNAIKREITGKASRRLRREGKLPAVVYGQRAASAIIELDNREFERVFARSGRTQLIDLVIDSGRPHKVLIKEVQLSPRRNTVLHVDFHQVSLRERLQVDVPVVVTGEAEPVRAGEADVLQVLHAVKVECMPTRIPELIEVDVSDLPEVDAAVRLSDLHVPEGVTVIGDPDDVVVKLAARRVVEVEEEEAAAEAVEEEAAPAAEAAEGAAAPEEG
ncbi:MAG TPA: 50S ribosomal protein L25 [Candidatus Dormibacteraeota bacterium]|nr:50S ribosomal protein L25 [Candidatus Dormibacteraeota bacterium]